MLLSRMLSQQEDSGGLVQWKHLSSVVFPLIGPGVHIARKLSVNDNSNSAFLQLLVAIMSPLKTAPSIHHSTPVNTPTPRTVSGSSPFPTDMEFISTSPCCRQSLSLITSLSGKCSSHSSFLSVHTHVHIHTRTHTLALVPPVFLKGSSLLSCFWLHHRWLSPGRT